MNNQTGILRITLPGISHQHSVYMNGNEAQKALE